jgi:hypothetical protein
MISTVRSPSIVNLSKCWDNKLIIKSTTIIANGTVSKNKPDVDWKLVENITIVKADAETDESMDAYQTKALGLLLKAVISSAVIRFTARVVSKYSSSPV